MHLFQGGQIGATELDTTKGSAWGLLNAATQHIDHEAGRSADARVKSAWFGHGETVIREEAKLLYVAMTRAMEMLLLTCHRETEFVKRLKTARVNAKT